MCFYWRHVLRLCPVHTQASWSIHSRGGVTYWCVRNLLRSFKQPFTRYRIQEHTLITVHRQLWRDHHMLWHSCTRRHSQGSYRRYLSWWQCTAYGMHKIRPSGHISRLTWQQADDARYCRTCYIQMPFRKYRICYGTSGYGRFLRTLGRI